jgi:hypothetical protein
MIKVLMEVETHATCLTVSVLAESLREAISTVKDCYPGDDVRVVFPINPEEFFVGDAGTANLVELDGPAEARAGIRQEGEVRE